MTKILNLFVILCLFGLSKALDNGLTLTPPMGWMSWQRYRCIVDCKDDPDNCISERLFTRMADAIVSEGYKEAGYEYIIIDDCWMDKKRDSLGRIQPDPERFPHGIKWLSDYIHSKGLKFGIYGDFGSLTCGGYPGSEYHMETDARSLKEWGVDYFKMDGCYADIKQFAEGYPTMGFYMNQTGRPIVFSCSWPAYQEGSMVPDYMKIAETCNLWRNYGDIDDSWESLKDIIKFYGDDKTAFAQVAGPGNFNDPDMLIIGNYGLSTYQEEVQMALWSIMTAPLIMSNDLPSVKASSKGILLNPHAIAINQDKLGIQGRRIKQIGQLEIWTKPILPLGNLAFAIVNFGDSTPTKITLTLSDLGISTDRSYNVFEVFSEKLVFRNLKRNDSFSTRINPSGVLFGKVVMMG